MILFSHPAPTAPVRHAALALNRAGVLEEFWTCLDERSHPVLVRLPASLLESSLVPAGPLVAAGGGRSFPFLEFTAPAATPNGHGPLAPGSPGVNLRAAAESLDHHMSTRLDTHPFTGVYAYEDGAGQTFRAAADRGLLRVYDVPAPHGRAVRSLLEEEAEREPEWATTLRPATGASQDTARRDAELAHADLVLASSTFVLETLEQAEATTADIAVLPHGGSPMMDEPTCATRIPHAAGKLRVLFVGELSQRAGLSYLFRACRELRHAVTLTVVGMPPPARCPVLERELRRVHWLPLSSPDHIRDEMTAHDVLVLPSLAEGSGTLLIDAMAAGLPIIATSHTAAPDIMEDGVEGSLIPIRSSEAIVLQLDLLRREPDRHAGMSANARRRARRLTWEGYERRLAAIVATALAQH
jgi:alpha-maltose-1-phosphate synthase